MARIGFLACETTMPGAKARRADAYEHDLYVAKLAPELARRGHELDVIDWEAPIANLAGLDLALIGTTWNYQDKAEAFLARLEALQAQGTEVCNPPEVARWNIDKRYLAELEGLGAPCVPTLWRARAEASDIAEAQETFGSERIVVKRQVGAGAEGQLLFGPDNPVPGGWVSKRPVMLQPFLPAIQREGEFSFIFIEGEFSHALRKSAAQGDYRIQSLYGGREDALAPPAEDLAAACEIAGLLPFPTTLYARIDMVRDDNGTLLLMEAELIEPYLYPEQGDRLGEKLAAAIERRLEARNSPTTYTA